ncbi:unnamed protein product [Protopolystoma xenopodis]|uniref:Uncharacterized protein n=1 Tax=Protopolystoma xenopodis TaxID=117903 RepID=A0A448WGK6_9PLAT|nr:unnamed protein product [Protopolystoma xenopodis]
MDGWMGACQTFMFHSAIPPGLRGRLVSEASRTTHARIHRHTRVHNRESGAHQPTDMCTFNRQAEGGKFATKRIVFSILLPPSQGVSVPTRQYGQCPCRPDEPDSCQRTGMGGWRDEEKLEGTGRGIEWSQTCRSTEHDMPATKRETKEANQINMSGDVSNVRKTGKSLCGKYLSVIERPEDATSLSSWSPLPFRMKLSGEVDSRCNLPNDNGECILASCRLALLEHSG